MSGYHAPAGFDPYDESSQTNLVCENCGAPVEPDGPDSEGRQTFVDSTGWDTC